MKQSNKPSLRSTISKVFDEFYDQKDTLVNYEMEDLLDAILQAVREVVPEERVYAPPEQQVSVAFRDGFNKCRADIRASMGIE